MHGLNFKELKLAIDRAKVRFSKLERKHPKMKAYLVLSASRGQTMIDCSLRQLLEEMPAGLVDGPTKTTALEILEKLQDAELLNEGAHKIKQLNDEIEALGPELEFDGDVLIELRFSALKYDLIWQLQKDELVDQKLTPQTKASIRIVLGSLGDFAK